jgi:hypothetical protein
LITVKLFGFVDVNELIDCDFDEIELVGIIDVPIFDVIELDVKLEIFFVVFAVVVVVFVVEIIDVDFESKVVVIDFDLSVFYNLEKQQSFRAVCKTLRCCGYKW